MSKQDHNLANGVQPKVMYHLTHIEPATVQEIAESTGCKESSVSSATRRLWRRGYLVRKKHRTEGRATDPYKYAIRYDEEIADE